MSLSEVLESCYADFARIGGQRGFLPILVSAFSRPAFGTIFFARLSRYTAEGSRLSRPLHLTLRALHHIYGRRAGIVLPWQNHIGPGLRIVGGRGLTINEGVVLGSNVTLYGGVTLGRQNRRKSAASKSVFPVFPDIGDNVRIGPNAVVLGATVGDNSLICPLSLVDSDIPARSVTFPVPRAPERPVRRPAPVPRAEPEQDVYPIRKLRASAGE